MLELEAAECHQTLHNFSDLQSRQLENEELYIYVAQQYYAKQLQISRNEDHKSLARTGRARRCITYDSGCFFESAYHCIDRSLTP